ncbi:hypothetical protein V3C99_003947 [Haemonchus contortus]|uniref:Uncharacterized protein n=1 Tax=Haemonchus contortus TaxID=6289 RepID=A0A7I4XXL5_HAECO
MLSLRSLATIFFVLVVVASSQRDHLSYYSQPDLRSSSEYTKRRAALRNCFLSPMQCLLPVDNLRFNKFHKRFFFAK